MTQSAKCNAVKNEMSAAHDHSPSRQAGTGTSNATKLHKKTTNANTKSKKTILCSLLTINY